MATKDSNELIRVENLTKRFGAFVAVDNVNYSLNRNEIITIVGPNGAGKTTFFNLLTGYFPPDGGSVLFDNKDISRLSPQRRVELGMIRTFQLTSTFDNLRVIDNLILSYFKARSKTSILSMLLSRMNSYIQIEKIHQYLETYELAHAAYRETKQLSLGEKRRLEIAMALIADPQVLLLDEPLAGLSEREINEVLEVIRRHIHKQTILVVEHKISKIKELTERLTVMYEGKVIADGSYEEVLHSPQVRKCYWQID